MRKVMFLITIVLIALIGLGYTKSVFALYINEPEITGIDYIDENSIKLNYKTNNVDPDYKVQIFNATLGKSYMTKIDETSYIVKGLEFGKSYNFLIRIYYKTAFNTSTSNWSNIVSGTPKARAPVINDIVSGDGSLVLNYTVSGSPEGVQIYLYNTKDGYISNNLNTHTLTGLTNGTTYRFLIRNYYGDEVFGPWSVYKDGIPIKPEVVDPTPVPIIKQKVIIVAGASQVDRMKSYTSSYSSVNKKTYSQKQGNLKFVVKSGSGISYQYGDGLKTIKSYMKKYDKKTTKFYLFYPLSGNTIKNFNCSSITKSNSSINSYAKNYNAAIEGLKKDGYNINGYVVSMHPVKVSQTKYSTVVKDSNGKSCTKSYRSNKKYYRFNQVIGGVIKAKYSSNLGYLDTFPNIMNIYDNGNRFTYKTTYNTVDGIHWNSDTTKKYVKIMLNKVKEL